MPRSVYAMSILGPEQAVRAFAAGCSAEHEHSRHRILFRGKDAEYTGVWQGRWRPSARQVAGTHLHLVSLHSDEEPDEYIKHPTYCVFAECGDSDAAIAEALYNRLIASYSTPLLPIGAPGQSDDEREAAETWRRVITSQIMADPALFVNALPHPEQLYEKWTRAGVLKISQETLDAMVKKLTQNGSLPFPGWSPRQTAVSRSSGTISKNSPLELART
jgi:hypothetical protein